MGSLGTSIRNTVRRLIADANLRTSITLTPLTRATGSGGGYSAVTETSGTARTIYGIPSSYIQDKIDLVKFGDLKNGEVRMLVRDDETLDTNDKVAFDSQTYNIRSIEPIYFNDVTIAVELILSERLG